MKNYKEKNRKIKKRKRLCTLLIIVIIWFLFGLFLKLTITNNEKLEKIGYSNIEIDIINELLNKTDIKKIYNYNYINILSDLLINKEFNSDKLTDYLEYYSKYPNINLENLLYIVNNDYEKIEYNNFNKEIILKENFDIEKMDRYQKYNQKYNLSIEDTIDAVNNNFDKYDIKYDKDYLKYLNHDYTIINNLKRYYNYQSKNNKSISEIISEVNSNLDLKPYEDYKDADTNSNEKILVNKYYKLDSNYEPDDLVNIDKKYGNGKIKKEVLDEYKKMYEDAKKDNVKLYIIKGYISYKEQQKLYHKNKYYYEKPGFSESQTGYSIEISNNDWLKNNCYKYGFILRYPSEKNNITGYTKEKYYRYVGKSISEFIHKNNISYEEYYAYFIENK